MKRQRSDPRALFFQCSRCKQIKAADEFSRHPPETGKRDTYCRPCRAEYGREHYAKNRRDYIAKAKMRTQATLRERFQYLFDYLSEHPCVDCGERDPVVLEFDHIENKDFGISNGMRTKSWNKVLAEIEKCEVRCANCHRRRTARVHGFFRARWLSDTEDQDLSG